VLIELIKQCDVLVENRSRRAGRTGFAGSASSRSTAHDPGLVKVSALASYEVIYENVPVRRRLRLHHRFRRPATATGAQIGDSGTGLHLCLGIVTALFQREDRPRPEGAGRHAGRRAEPVPRQAAATAPARKGRDTRSSPKAIRRRQCRARASLRWWPAGLDLVQGLQHDPSYIYFIPRRRCGRHLQGDRRGDLDHDPSTAPGAPAAPRRSSRASRVDQDQTKFEAMRSSTSHIPRGPSVHEGIAGSRARATGTVVEIDHPTRGKYLASATIKMSDSETEVTRSPPLGEHREVLATGLQP
jgi:formyl-CoA transferase